MGKFIDLTGQRFGSLVVVKRVEDYVQQNGRHRIQWLCKCDCGNEKIVRSENLTSGNTKSCGCLHIKTVSEQFRKYNTYDLSNKYGTGYTSNGEEFYFDLEDYNKIKDYYWSINSDGYVYAHAKDSKKRGNKLLMHRLVMNVQSKPYNIIVDHIHGKNTRNDNRKSNLRLVTHSQNLMNSSKSKRNKSGITGVHFDNNLKKWIADICVNREIYRKGFKNKNDAIKQRKLWEEEYFGEYSYESSQLMGV